MDDGRPQKDEVGTNTSLSMSEWALVRGLIPRSPGSTMRRNGPRGAGAPDKTWAKVWAKIKEKFPMDREESFRLAAGAILEYCVPEDWGTEASVPDWNVPTVKDLSSLSSSKVGDITSPLIAKLVAQDDTCDLCLEDQTGSIPILFTDPPPPHMHETMLLVRRWRLNISAVKSQSRLYLPYIEAEDWKPISCCLVESPFLERNYVMTVSDFANHITQSGSASTIKNLFTLRGVISALSAIIVKNQRSPYNPFSFIELTHGDCVTAILFVEKECVRWRPFLSQGQEVIISNLANTKMFPKTRRERFILVAHPSTRPHVSIVYQPQHMHSTESEAIISNSSVMASSSASSTMLTTSISPEDPNTAPCLSFAQLHEYTSMWETQQEREIEVVSYCGTITGRQHGFILQLDGSVKVFLQHHWTRGRGLRNGARITLHNTHPIIYNGKFIGFGFCIYGHISVGRFSSSTECFYPIIHSSSRLFPYMEHLSIPDSIWFNESFQSFSSQFPSLSLDELLGSTDMKGHMQEIIRHLGAVQLIRDVYDQFISHHVGGNICATISSGFSKQPPKFVSLCELMKTVETNILAESLSQVITDEDLEQKVWTAGFLVMSADLKSLSLFDNVNRLPAIVPDALPHHLGKLCIVNKFNFICETNPRHIIQFMMADSLHFSHTSVDLPFTHKDDEVPASSSFILLAKNKRLSHNGFSVLGHLIQVDNQGQHEKHNESVTLNFAGRDTGHYVFIKPNNYYSIKGARDVNKSSSSIITIIPPSSIEAASLVSAEDMTPHLCIHETSHKVSLTRMEEASLAAQHTTIHNVRDLLSMAGPDTELFSFRGTLISKALFPSNSLLTIQDVSQPHLISMKIPLSLHPTGLVPGSIVTFFKCTKHIEASLIKMFFNDESFLSYEGLDRTRFTPILRGQTPCEVVPNEMDKQLLENLPTVSLLELSKSLSTKFTQVTVRINSVTVTPIRVTVSYSGGTTHWKSLCILDDGSNTAYLHCEEESTLTILSISKEVQEEILVYCHSKGSFEWSHSHIVNKAQVYNPADAYDEIYNRTLDYLDTVDLCSNSLFIVYAWAMVPHQSAQPTLGNKVSLQAYYVERPNYITETTRMLASLLKDSHS